MKNKFTLFIAIVVALYLAGCNNIKTTNVIESDSLTQKTESVDNTVTEDDSQEAAIEVADQADNNNQESELNNTLELKLSDFLVPMKGYNQYLISENIPETLENIKFKKGKRSSGKKIHIMGGPGKSYKTTFTRNYNDSDITIVLEETEYKYDGEDINNVGVEITFTNDQDKERFLSDLPQFRNLNKVNSSNGQTTYQDKGDLRINVRGNTVSIKYDDYSL